MTGRHLRDGTTNLLIDLKKRQLQNEDKLNYELNIGSRRLSADHSGHPQGVWCGRRNLHQHRRELPDRGGNERRERIETSFKNFLRADMQVDENILSKDGYAKALKGKRHFKDEAF